MPNPEKKKAATVHPALKAVAGRFRCEANTVLEIASGNAHPSNNMQHNSVDWLQGHWVGPWRPVSVNQLTPLRQDFS